MDIEESVKRLSSKMGKALLAAAVRERPTASKQQLDDHVKKLSEHLSAERRRDAMATGLSLVMAKGDAAIARMRQKGVLRASRYEFRSGDLKHVIEAILNIKSTAKLSDNHTTYLQSHLALLRLAPATRRMHDELLKLLRPRKEKALKTLLVFANQLFINDGSQEERRLFAAFSREEIVEAISMLVDLIKRQFKLSSQEFILVDEDILKKNNDYGRILLNALQMRKVREAETFIDALPYQAEMLGKICLVSSIDPSIEKSIRLGYIQTELQRAVRLEALSKLKDKYEIYSLQEMVEKGFASGLGEMVKYYDRPLRRLVFEMPAHPNFFAPLFGGNALFEEEWADVLMLNVDAPWDEFDRITNITDTLSSMDVIKVQRLFRFVSYVYHKKLGETQNESERELMNLRSVIPVFHLDQLVSMIRMVVPERAEELIDLMTLDENRDHIDLQYTPFIKADQHYMIAPRIVAESNLVRNLVVAHNLRPKLTVSKDPMQQEVFKSLESAGFKVCQELELKIDGKNYELDIVAWLDDWLFLFECKNAYLPCSVHEMRNSYDHIVKAGEQLEVRLAILRETAHQKALFKVAHWDVEPTEKILTGILIANRVFHGSNQRNHPVRHAHELANVLLRGQIRLNDSTLSFWKGAHFQVEDLVDYLTHGTIARVQLESLQPVRKIFQFEQKFLAFQTYQMDFQLTALTLQSKYSDAPEDV